MSLYTQGQLLAPWHLLPLWALVATRQCITGGDGEEVPGVLSDGCPQRIASQQFPPWFLVVQCSWGSH